jgi:microcystin-dependent protein
MQQLTYRITKGTDLTNLEIDDNFRKLRTAINSLEASIIAAGSSLPIGAWYGWTGDSEPVDALFLNGRAVSRVTYADLFAIIGIKYGAGDGVSTFNLPDWRGVVIMGTNPMGGLTRGAYSNRAEGTYYGAETVTIAHSHTGSGTVTINQFTVTPSGTVTIDDYAGSAPVTVNSTAIPYVPAGTVVVEIADHTDTITEAAPGHMHSVTIPPVNITEGAETPIDVGDDGVYNTSQVQVEIDLNSQPLVHNVTSASFAGTATNFNHTHTADAVDISHGHTGSFAGVGQNITPTGSASVTVNSASPVAAIIQPSGVSNFVIKYR